MSVAVLSRNVVPQFYGGHFANSTDGFRRLRAISFSHSFGESLDMISSPIERCVIRKGSRVIGLLGRATTTGIVPFAPADVGVGWAVTAEHGTLRLEQLSGDEESTGLELFLPTAFSRDYGIAGAFAAPTLTRAVFGMLPAELDEMLAVLRQGNFPQMALSRLPLRCAISSAIIPSGWPHVLVSNQPLYGNVICLESFIRILVSSLPEGKLATRFPSLFPTLKRLMTLAVSKRAGAPYLPEVLKCAPLEPAVPKPI